MNIKNKKNEIDFIEKGVCPTCGAAIDQSQLEIKKQEMALEEAQQNKSNLRLRRDSQGNEID